MALGATAQQQPSLQVLEIEQINVSGTRIPADSIIRLSGLQAHAMNELKVISACQKITAASLFKKVDYTYEGYSDRPVVALNLVVVDEGPLIPPPFLPRPTTRQSGQPYRRPTPSLRVPCRQHRRRLHFMRKR